MPNKKRPIGITILVSIVICAFSGLFVYKVFNLIKDYTSYPIEDIDLTKIKNGDSVQTEILIQSNTKGEFISYDKIHYRKHFRRHGSAYFTTNFNFPKNIKVSDKKGNSYTLSPTSESAIHDFATSYDHFKWDSYTPYILPKNIAVDSSYYIIQVIAGKDNKTTLGDTLFNQGKFGKDFYYYNSAEIKREQTFNENFFRKIFHIKFNNKSPIYGTFKLIDKDKKIIECTNVLKFETVEKLRQNVLKHNFTKFETLITWFAALLLFSVAMFFAYKTIKAHVLDLPYEN